MWYAEAETDVNTVNAFIAVGSRALTMVKDAFRLGGCQWEI